MFVIRTGNGPTGVKLGATDVKLGVTGLNQGPDGQCPSGREALPRRYSVGDEGPALGLGGGVDGYDGELVVDGVAGDDQLGKVTQIVLVLLVHVA